MASVLQVLFALPHFQQKYHAPAEHHLSVCQAAKPADCFQCQMSKLALGLLSGRYDPQPSAEELQRLAAERQARAARQKALKEGAPAQPADSDESKKRKKPVSVASM